MKRRALVVGAVAMAIMAPSPAAAFHHGGLPSTVCASDNAGSPSNNNGMAREALAEHNPHGLPLAPVGTPGQGQGEGEHHCANR